MPRMSNARYARLEARIDHNLPQNITTWTQCVNRPVVAQMSGVPLQDLDAYVKESRLRYPNWPLLSHQQYGLGVADPTTAAGIRLIEEYVAWRQGNVITRVTVDLANLDRAIESRTDLTQVQKDIVRLSFRNAIAAAGMITVR